MSEFVFEDAVAMAGSPVFDSISGTCQVLENGGVRPTNLIKTTSSWFARIRLRTEGLSANGAVGGSWQLRLHLEGIGLSAPELDLPALAPVQIPLRPAAVSAIDYGSPTDAAMDVTTAAGVVPAGTYKLVATATYVDLAGAPGPIAGFCEGPVLQFYVP